MHNKHKARGFTVDPSIIEWDNRRAKRVADEFVFRSRPFVEWAETPGAKRVLSFPAVGWWWERDFLKFFPTTPSEFVGLERLQGLHFKMCRHAKDNPVARLHKLSPHTWPVSFIRYARAFKVDSKPFDMIYLDWMGSWSTDKENELHVLFQKAMLKPGGMLRFTMAMNRGKPEMWRGCEIKDRSFQISDFRGSGAGFEEWRVYGVPNMAVDIAAKCGYRLKIVSAQFYHSYGPNNHITPEGSFLFKLRP